MSHIVMQLHIGKFKQGHVITIVVHGCLFKCSLKLLKFLNESFLVRMDELLRLSLGFNLSFDLHYHHH